MDNGKTSQAVQNAISAAASQISGKAIGTTSAAIAAAGAIIQSQQSKAYKDALISNLIAQAEVAGYNKLKILATLAAIENAALQTAANNDIPNRDTAITLPEQDDPDLSSEAYLGTIINRDYIYGSIIFGDMPPGQAALSWVDQFGVNRSLPRIPIAVAIINADVPKNVVITDIQGRDGSVKEYIGTGDVTCTIDCEVPLPMGNGGVDIISNELYSLFTCPYAIPITNYFLNAMGVTHIVITRYSSPQKRGEYSNLYFTVQAVQDIPITTLLP